MKLKLEIIKKHKRDFQSKLIESANEVYINGLKQSQADVIDLTHRMTLGLPIHLTMQFKNGVKTVRIKTLEN